MRRSISSAIGRVRDVHAEAPAPTPWDRLSEMIAARTGLHFPPERHADLRRAVVAAAPEFGFTSERACAEWLLSARLSSADLRTLATHLTIGETYFFRERPSFNAIANEVLPILIHRRRGAEKRLRIWSAACSTGEEAYSLAIMLQQILPDWRDWNISILATDINTMFLRKAEAGIYGEWSFRESGPDFRQRYFTPCGDRRYRIHADVRELVTFAELNLAQDGFPSVATDTNAMDLILCRNVLIYFTPAHARRLIASLRHALVDDGWLIVAPSECSQALFGGFTPVNFPGSILYRKRGPAEPAPRSTDIPQVFKPEPPPSPPLGAHAVDALLSTDHVATAPPPPHATLHDDARALYVAGDYGDAVAALRAGFAASAHMREDARLLGLYAHALANQGDLPAALDASERWIERDKLDAAAHYLNAMVLQELGERIRSRGALQRAIYLEPGFTLAHFALGNCARAEARHAEAQKHFRNAARLLEARDADEAVPESEGLTVGRMREIITALTLGNDA
jgi:chemotaxis protein methyltransferase CheR